MSRLYRVSTTGLSRKAVSVFPSSCKQIKTSRTVGKSYRESSGTSDQDRMGFIVIVQRGACSSPRKHESETSHNPELGRNLNSCSSLCLERWRHLRRGHGMLEPGSYDQ